jgi:hypothetical protein
VPESADKFRRGPGCLRVGTEVHQQLEDHRHVHRVTPEPAAPEHRDGVR